jgi:hypothetical protein
MNSLFYKNAPLNACLITHFRSIRGTHQYICINKFYKHSVDCVTYHTLHTYTVPRQYVCIDVSSDCSVIEGLLIYTVIHHNVCLMFYQTVLWTEFLFTHITHIGFSIICMCWCVIRLLFQLNSFLHTSQIQGYSTINMGWEILKTICWLYDLLHTKHLQRRSTLCMCWWFIRLLCWLNAFALSPLCMRLCVLRWLC